jgi:hypothetical protein
VRTPVSISTNAIYRNVTDSDDQFDVFPTASLILRAVDVFTDDAITGSGLVRVSGSTTIENNLMLDDTVTFANASTVTQHDAALIIGQLATDSALVRNDGGATWDLTDGSQIISSGTSSFVNLGTLEQTGGVSTIDGTFTDRNGAITIDGRLDFAAGVNRFVNDTIDGSGIFQLEAGTLDGSTVSTTEALLDGRIVGDVTISSTTIGGSVTLAPGANLTLTSGTLTLFQITGASGEVDIRGNVGFYQGLSISGGITLDNFGDAGVSGPAQFASITISLSGGAVIENEENASWGEGAFRSEIEGNGQFVNDGTFTSGNGDYEIDFVNNGVVQPGATNLVSFSDGISGTGTVDLGSSILDVGGQVSSGQTFDFSPASGVVDKGSYLTIDSLPEFFGTVAGFGDGTNDTITTKGFQYEDFTPSNDGTGGTLTFTNGSTEANLSLSGSYNPNGFHANGDELTYSST